MILSELQDSLVEHQKQKNVLFERLQEIVNQMNSLQEEHQMVIKQGQLVEGGIMLLDTLIEQEKLIDEGK